MRKCAGPAATHLPLDVDDKCHVLLMHSLSMNIEDGHTHLVEGSDAHLVGRCKRTDDWVQRGQ